MERSLDAQTAQPSAPARIAAQSAPPRVLPEKESREGYGNFERADRLAEKSAAAPVAAPAAPPSPQNSNVAAYADESALTVNGAAGASGNAVALARRAATPEACHSVVLTGTLIVGQRFEKEIGENLALIIEPLTLGANGQSNGWQFRIAPVRAPEQDYIAPVNLPLRMSGTQYLGPNHGESAEQSLGRAHQARFLLNAADYARIQPLWKDALWPYNAPNPDKAADAYVSAISSVPTGTVELAVPDFRMDAGRQAIRQINFRAVIGAPANFSFDPRLRPHPAVCSDSPK